MSAYKRRASIDDFNNSPYISQHEVDPPIVVTIAEWWTDTLREGEEPRLIVGFEEDDVKPLVLSASVNRETIAAIAGTRFQDDWIGVQLELYRDPTVRNPNGQITGGTRVRMPAGRQTTDPQAPLADPDLDDDLDHVLPPVHTPHAKPKTVKSSPKAKKKTVSRGVRKR